MVQELSQIVGRSPSLHSVVGGEENLSGSYLGYGSLSGFCFVPLKTVIPRGRFLDFIQDAHAIAYDVTVSMA